VASGWWLVGGEVVGLDGRSPSIRTGNGGGGGVGWIEKLVASLEFGTAVKVFGIISAKRIQVL